MVSSVTSFGRSGLSDWLIQRVSGVIIAAYFFFMIYWLVGHKGVDYPTWLALHQLTCMKIFNSLTLASIVAHSWIGIWGVLTDYITVRMLGAKATVLRLVLEIGAIGLLVVYAIWGLAIIWGV
jgi:succinate dehydrogenase / fumarate reductase membrane anchor subunit